MALKDTVTTTFGPLDAMPPTVIALSGPAGCGKSTLAAALAAEFGFRRTRFAGPLKDMMRAIGLSENEIEGDLKEVPSAKLAGRTPRYAMQRLGTEWGRELMDPEIWVRLWANRVAVSDAPRIVAEDCRFQNEADAVRALGGIVVGISRADTQAKVAGGHVSESGVVPDLFVTNDGKDIGQTIEHLRFGLRCRLADWTHGAPHARAAHTAALAALSK